MMWHYGTRKIRSLMATGLLVMVVGLWSCTPTPVLPPPTTPQTQPAPAPSTTPAPTPPAASNNISAPEPATVPASTPATGTANLTVVGHLNVAAGPNNITDVWAQATADGRSYAYLGTYDEPSCDIALPGVHVIDISDPTNPVKAGFIPSSRGQRVNDVKVRHIETPAFNGDILIHSTEVCRGSPLPREGRGIVIYDVTEPLSPKLLARDFLNFEVHNLFIYQQKERAFVLVVEDGGPRDFHIVDITNPASPKEVSAQGAIEWFDPARDQLFLGTFPVPLLHDVWAQVYPEDFPDGTLAGKTIAYLSYWDAGLVILDITDPAHPVFLGDSDYLDPDPLNGRAPEGNSHVAVPTADGKLVFMGDEDFSTTQIKFTVDTGNFAGEYRTIEASFTIPADQLPEKTLKGPVTYIGQACSTDQIPPPPQVSLALGESHIALIERGICAFDEKIGNAARAGYGGAIVFGSLEAPAQLIPMGGNPAKGTIPALFVSRFAAFAMLGISPSSPPDTPLPPVGTRGQSITAQGGVFDGWGYGRILDISDPAHIVEVGQYATENVLAEPPPPEDHSMHNVIVEGRRAYISWYADGIRVVDFSDPEKPVEIAKFVDTVNGSDFWGVYLFHHPNGKSYILGSDRDTGLWIFDVP
ncbi:MAG: hypothetical protein HYX83_00105 [Chloroflexi bacterium]|nr:hypothetical protein [Chloroflexota bacterium]